SGARGDEFSTGEVGPTPLFMVHVACKSHARADARAVHPLARPPGRAYPADRRAGCSAPLQTAPDMEVRDETAAATDSVLDRPSPSALLDRSPHRTGRSRARTLGGHRHDGHRLDAGR